MQSFWTKPKTLAAQMTFEGHTVDEIVVETGRSAKWIYELRKKPEFALRLEELALQAAEALAGEGIRNKDNQLRALQGRWDKTNAVITQRAAAPPMSARNADLKSEDVPGWDTGLLVHDVKTSKDGAYDIYSVDTPLLAEIRAIEKQAAQVAGWWVEKGELAGAGGGPIVVRQYPGIDPGKIG